MAPGQEGRVKRISGLIYKETRGVMKVFLENVVCNAVTYTVFAKRKTVTGITMVLCFYVTLPCPPRSNSFKRDSIPL